MSDQKRWSEGPEMGHATLLDHLAMTRRHVIEGAAILARQRDLIARIAEQGGNTAAAVLLLKQFEQTQAEHIAHRDRLEALL
ncbi:MAG TPA: hypothetical protein VHY35_03695 [Stellaceae bacterium]|jgi:hypothetical protein|nr:hypothetical protein [Stellaceae bacterium]